MATELAFQVHRDSTVEAHQQAVERVILQMRLRFADPFTLHDMSRIACLSQFHFDRIFRQTTGIPAVQFLYALRIEAAKRLLLTTALSVTDVCYEVGYNSIGTFTSRFTQLVGVSPRGFRHLAETVEDARLKWLFRRVAASFENNLSGPGIRGRVLADKPFKGLIFIGLFPSLIPQSHPIAATLLTSTGSYRISPIRDGESHVFAAAFPPIKDSLAYLLPEAASLLVGVGNRPVSMKRGMPGNSVDVVLRQLQITDPPILIALPFLLTESLKDHD